MSTRVGFIGVLDADLRPVVLLVQLTSLSLSEQLVEVVPAEPESFQYVVQFVISADSISTESGPGGGDCAATLTVNRIESIAISGFTAELHYNLPRGGRVALCIIAAFRHCNTQGAVDNLLRTVTRLTRNPTA